MPSVYLAGPIANCTGDQARGWRQSARRYLAPLGITVFDPTQRVMRGAETIEMDLAQILDSAVVVANCWKPSVGTSMEIMYASVNGIPVVVAGENLSPWIHHHADSVWWDHYSALHHAVQMIHAVRGDTK